MIVESTDAERECTETVERLLVTRPRIRLVVRFRPSGAESLDGLGALALARRLEMSLLMSSSLGLEWGWPEGAGAVDTVLDGEFGSRADKGSVRGDGSNVASDGGISLPTVNDLSALLSSNLSMAVMNDAEVSNP